ncbi:hypothetical protein XENOCAPTIV_018699 [Xenoophorus captivus]|uniref:Uncharacterized protein n=1 Tax=Xenoophorus captivus TaxID=1517983 RepID=A0ABV0QK49_9TELE
MRREARPSQPFGLCAMFYKIPKFLRCVPKCSSTQIGHIRWSKWPICNGPNRPERTFGKLFHGPRPNCSRWAAPVARIFLNVIRDRSYISRNEEKRPLRACASHVLTLTKSELVFWQWQLAYS